MLDDPLLLFDLLVLLEVRHRVHGAPVGARVVFEIPGRQVPRLPARHFLVPRNHALQYLHQTFQPQFAHLLLPLFHYGSCVRRRIDGIARLNLPFEEVEDRNVPPFSKDK